jgi:hypothetical protein
VQAIVLLGELQHFGDWELYLPQFEQLLLRKINLENELKQVIRRSTVIAVTHV